MIRNTLLVLPQEFLSRLSPLVTTTRTEWMDFWTKLTSYWEKATRRRFSPPVMDSTRIPSLDLSRSLSTSCSGSSPDYSNHTIRSLCNAYAQLGAKGVSIIFSSGDGGVAGSQTSTCSASFLPTFPSTCSLYVLCHCSRL